jgi:hypothetical protein
MALSGVHVTCCYAGGNSDIPTDSFPLVGEILWSQTMASGGTTTESAPLPERPNRTRPLFQVYGTADFYVAIGPFPNASGNQRAFVPAYTLREFYCVERDKLAWVLA